MTSDVYRVEEVYEEGPSGSPLSWEVPEIAGVSVLAVTALLATGGLATGIAQSVTVADGSLPSGQLTWTAVLFGAQWASPEIAVLLLGVLGLCWYQIQVWSELLDSAGSEADDEEVDDARGHIGRARRMATWALVALGLTALGSLAGCIAVVELHAGQASSIVVTDIYPGASTLADFLLLAAGYWIDRRVAGRSASAPLSVSAT